MEVDRLKWKYPDAVNLDEEPQEDTWVGPDFRETVNERAMVIETEETGILIRDFPRRRPENSGGDDRGDYRKRDNDYGRDRRDTRDRSDTRERPRESSDRYRDKPREYSRGGDDEDRYRNRERDNKGYQPSRDRVRDDRPRRTERNSNDDGKSD